MMKSTDGGNKHFFISRKSLIGAAEKVKCERETDSSGGRVGDKQKLRERDRERERQRQRQREMS